MTLQILLTMILYCKKLVPSARISMGELSYIIRQKGEKYEFELCHIDW